MMSDADLTAHKGTEGKAGEDLTLRSDGEGSGVAHGVRCFDSFNIQEMRGSDEMVCQFSNWHPDPGRALKKPPCGGGVSVETHTGEEWDRSSLLAHKPVESFLKDPLSGDAVLSQNGIQTALSGSGLPAAVEEFNEAFADSGNQVAMQTDLGSLTFKGNGGVGFAPVGAGSDGAVHLDFDFAHDAGV